jgi:hypothetical protein
LDRVKVLVGLDEEEGEEGVEELSEGDCEDASLSNTPTGSGVLKEDEDELDDVWGTMISSLVSTGPSSSPPSSFS